MIPVLICQRCPHQLEEMFLLPAQGTGQKERCCFICRDCALASGLFCQRHSMRPHHYVGQDDHVCVACVDEQTQGLMEELVADGWASDFLQRLTENLPRAEWARLMIWARLTGEQINSFSERVIFRALVVLAQKRGCSVRAVTTKLIAAKSVDALKPWLWYDRSLDLLEAATVVAGGE